MFGEDRSTAELVVIIFATTIAFVLVAACLGVIATELLYPDVDTGAVAEPIREAIGVLIGAVVGYMSGRNVAPRLRPGRDRDPARTHGADDPEIDA